MRPRCTKRKTLLIFSGAKFDLPQAAAKRPEPAVFPSDLSHLDS
jgi:hypothetical protein